MRSQPTLPVDEARELLGCREGASTREVQGAYRRLLHTLRPDLGGRVPGEQMLRVQAARDVLLRTAGPDRRRRERPRGERRPLREVLPLRRSTWQLAEEPPRSIDQVL